METVICRESFAIRLPTSIVLVEKSLVNPPEPDDATAWDAMSPSVIFTADADEEGEDEDDSFVIGVAAAATSAAPAGAAVPLSPLLFFISIPVEVGDDEGTGGGGTSSPMITDCRPTTRAHKFIPGL